MRESELQHLTAMTKINLKLTRRLFLDTTDMARKITQLQQETSKLQTEMKTKTSQMQATITAEIIKKQQTGTSAEQKKLCDEQSTTTIVELKKELSSHTQRIQRSIYHIERHTGGACSGCQLLTFPQYSKMKASRRDMYSKPFYSNCSYKFILSIHYHGFPSGTIGARLHLLIGEQDDNLQWPLEVRVQLKLLNLAGSDQHVVRVRKVKWLKENRENFCLIDNGLMKYSELERASDSVQYLMNDSFKLSIHVTI